MQPLFNGKDLNGWDGDPRLWSVKDGVIHGETTTENPAKGNTFLVWKDGTLKDFDLRLSFRCNATNNSGIQYRSKHITDGKSREPVGRARLSARTSQRTEAAQRRRLHLRRRGQARPHLPRRRKGDVGRRWQEGHRQDLIDAEDYEKLFKLDDWNDVVIIAKGNHIQHYLNGRLILDFTDEPPGTGPEGRRARRCNCTPANRCWSSSRTSA